MASGKKNKQQKLKFTRFTKYFNKDYDHSIQNIIKNPQFRLTSALVLTAVSLILLLSFISYIFTWKADQDKVYGFSTDYLFGNETVSNLLGRLGALMAHSLFFNGFGVAAFIIVFFTFALSVKLLTNTSEIRIKKILLYSTLAIAWLSPTLAYFFESFAFPFGGAYGDFISSWLQAFLGIGTVMILALAPLSFAIIHFKIDYSIFNVFKRVRMPDLFDEKNKNDFDFLTDEDESELFDTVIEKDQVKSSDVPPTEELEIENEELLEKPDEQLLDLEMNTTDEIEVGIEEDGLSFDIEESKEESIVNTSSEISNNYDPTRDLSNYNYPTLDLLEDHGTDKVQINKEELERNKNQIVETLNHYKIKIEKIRATIGPTITLYEIVPAPGTRISKIKNLEDDIALSLSALGIRIIAPIPGKGTIGIEVPNEHKEVVAMKTALASEKFVNAKMDLPLVLGKTISNEVLVCDLAKAPHMLIAGATGQGKSVGINSILVSLLYKKHPSQLKLVLVDPKKVELSIYTKIEKHFLAKLPNSDETIITDTRKVVNTLNSLCMEMDQRYDLLKNAMVRNIKEYNEKFTARKLNPEKGHRFLPYIVLVIDEFADLIMTAGKEIETPIARLAQLARAIGIHLIIATQRPSVNIITGMIKANFPTRIAFKVTSKIDSRTILDGNGADQLIGRGDMLYAPGSDMIRLQCPFVDTPEVEKIVDFIGDQRGYPSVYELPEYLSDDDSGPKEFDHNQKDAMFEDAARTVVAMQSGSTSMLQRRMQLGYNRAGRIMDQLEAAGIVGSQEGSKPREVLVSSESELESILESLQQPT